MRSDREDYLDLTGDGRLTEISAPDQASSRIVARFPATPEFLKQVKNGPLYPLMFTMRSRLCRLGFHLESSKIIPGKFGITVTGNLRSVVKGFPTYGKPLGNFFQKNSVLGRIFLMQSEAELTLKEIMQATQESGDEKPSIELSPGRLIDEKGRRVLIPLEPVIYTFPNKSDHDVREKLSRICWSSNSCRKTLSNYQKARKVEFVALDPGEALISQIRLKIGNVFAVIEEHCEPSGVIHLPARVIDPFSPHDGHDTIHVELFNNGKDKERVINPMVPVRFYRVRRKSQGKNGRKK